MSTSTELRVHAEGVHPRPIEPTITFSLSNKKVLVFDDVFTTEFIETFGVFLLKQPYELRASFDNEMSAALSADRLESLPAIVDVVSAIITRHHSHMCDHPVEQTLTHGYAAAIRFGDSSVLHRDIVCGDCVTFLYYGNLVWRARWGGETIFYDDSLSSPVCVAPKPGRLVCFNAGLHHRAGIPTRDCPTFRYGLSLFYRCRAMSAVSDGLKLE